MEEVAGGREGHTVSVHMSRFLRARASAAGAPVLRGDRQEDDDSHVVEFEHVGRTERTQDAHFFVCMSAGGEELE